MKNIILKSLALSLLLIVAVTGFSQDKIYKKNQDLINCKVVELGKDVVKYTQDETGELILNVDISSIDKIVFESGKVLTYNENKENSLLTQDRIYKKNQDVIVCTIIELGEVYIKYTQDDTKDLAFSIDVVRIEKLVFASGKEITFNDRINDPELYFGQSKNAFKVGLFSPATGALSFAYERSLKPGASFEATLGLIGVGFTDFNNNNAKGAYIDGGYKFIMTPSYHTPGVTYGHLLKGFYFKPKFALAMYGKDFNVYDPNTGFNKINRKDVVAGAFMLDMGWQWIIGDAFLLNMYGGFGYGFDNVSSADYGYQDYYDEPQYHYGFTVGGNVPLAFTAGLKIGFTK